MGIRFCGNGGFNSDSGAAFLAMKNMFRKAATSAKDAFTVIQEEAFDMTFVEGITDPVKEDTVPENDSYENEDEEEDDNTNTAEEDDEEMDDESEDAEEEEDEEEEKEEEEEEDDDGESEYEEIDYEELEKKLTSSLGVKNMSVSFGDSAGDDEYEIKVNRIMKRKRRIGVCYQGGES